MRGRINLARPCRLTMRSSEPAEPFLADRCFHFLRHFCSRRSLSFIVRRHRTIYGNRTTKHAGSVTAHRQAQDVEWSDAATDERERIDDNRRVQYLIRSSDPGMAGKARPVLSESWMKAASFAMWSATTIPPNKALEPTAGAVAVRVRVLRLALRGVRGCGSAFIVRRLRRKRFMKKLTKPEKLLQIARRATKPNIEIEKRDVEIARLRKALAEANAEISKLKEKSKPDDLS